MNSHQPRWHRVLEIVLGAALYTVGWILTMTLVGAPLGIPIFLAGLALLLPEPHEKPDRSP